MAAGGTILSYNGITLSNCLTRQFDEEAVYDDSGTDVLYHKFTIEVVSYVHSANTQINNRIQTQPIFSSTTGNQYLGIRAPLMHPRGDFRYTLADGTPILIAKHGANNSEGVSTPTLDVNNGPKPLHCNVTQVAGSNTLRISYAIEICIVDCSNQNNQGVLNNRWAMTDEIDEDWFTTRTITGRIRIAKAELDVQNFRQWVIPPLQPGFYRKSMHFATSPDNLTCDYMIVDQEVYAAAPYPSTTWRGTQVFSTEVPGMMNLMEVSVQVKGPPRSDKKVLIQLAAQIIESRLTVKFKQLNGGDGGSMLLSAAIVDNLQDSSIEMRVRVRLSKKPISGLFGGVGDMLGSPLNITNYNLYISPDPSAIQIAAPWGLFISYLQTPCDSNHMVQKVLETSPSYSPGEGGPAPKKPDISIGQQLFSENASWSQEQQTSPYTYYKIHNQYVTNGNKLQLPKSQSSSGGTGSGGGSKQPTCAFVTLTKPTMMRVVHIEAERSGDWPDVQAFQDITDPIAGSECPLLNFEFEPLDPVLQADGYSRSYTVRAKYFYGMPNPPDQFAIGENPWMKPNQGLRGPDTQFPGAALANLLSKGATVG